jgi:hypothetical protein
VTDDDNGRRDAPAIAADPDRWIAVLSLEYETLRNEILTRTTGRFQFLGLMTTAAALVGTGMGSSRLNAWASGLIAIAIFMIGLAGFGLLGRQILNISARVADLEGRINHMMGVGPGDRALLSWETARQRRSRFASLTLRGVSSSEASLSKVSLSEVSSSEVSLSEPGNNERTSLAG